MLIALHSFIGSTEIYAHVDMSDVRKPVEKQLKNLVILYQHLRKKKFITHNLFAFASHAVWKKNNICIVDKRIGHSASKGCQERALQDLLSSPYCDKTGMAPLVNSAGNKC